MLVWSHQISLDRASPGASIAKAIKEELRESAYCQADACILNDAGRQETCPGDKLLTYTTYLYT